MTMREKPSTYQLLALGYIGAIVMLLIMAAL